MGPRPGRKTLREEGRGVGGEAMVRGSTIAPLPTRSKDGKPERRMVSISGLSGLEAGVSSAKLERQKAADTRGTG